MAEPNQNGNRKEVTITRIFDAPPELVFKAWTDPTLVAQWWGPKGFTNAVCEFNVLPGGSIRIDMRGPDGVVYPMKGIFHEIVKPERIVLTTSAFEDKEGNPLLEVLNTVTFAEQDGKTKLTLHAVVVKSGPEVAPALDGMEDGWRQSIDRLAAHLNSADQRWFVITRMFDSPCELVWNIFTESSILCNGGGRKDSRCALLDWISDPVAFFITA